MKKVITLFLLCSALSGCIVAPAPAPRVYYPAPGVYYGGGCYHCWR